MFNLLGAIAQFERELTRERMLVGIAKAKAEGKYKGRAPTARAKADRVRELRKSGVGPSEIARQVGISPDFSVSHSKHPAVVMAMAVKALNAPKEVADKEHHITQQQCFKYVSVDYGNGDVSVADEQSEYCQY